MVKEIVRDINILSQKSTKADKSDLFIVKDLLDTADFHKERCCGLAAIQLGYSKRIIVVFDGEKFVSMVNPMITKKSTEKYTSEEGCMSFDITQEVTRHKNIAIMYTDQYGKIKKQMCGTILSQIIQHEVDHLNGKLI